MSSPKQTVKEETHPSFIAKAGTNVCLRSATRKEVLAGDVTELRATLFHVEDAVLERASPVFRDMIVLGRSTDSKTPAPLEEDAKTIEHLLHFMEDDIAKHPDTSTMPAEELVKLYSASIKYQTCLIQNIVEHSLRFRLMSKNDKIYATTNLCPIIKLACAHDCRVLVTSIAEGVARQSTNLAGSQWQDVARAVGGPGNCVLMMQAAWQLANKAETIRVDAVDVKRRTTGTAHNNTHAAIAAQRETLTVIDRMIANLAKLLQ